MMIYVCIYVGDDKESAVAMAVIDVEEGKHSSSFCLYFESFECLQCNGLLVCFCASISLSIWYFRISYLWMRS
ncbi:hypothetical protein L1887_33819 [Cichorium endivia]|nr:hypothetical protein L1887_33819 [Cichorium endivia]